MEKMTKGKAVDQIAKMLGSTRPQAMKAFHLTEVAYMAGYIAGLEALE